MVWEVVEAPGSPSGFGLGPTGLLLLQVPPVRVIPPSETQDYQERTLGSTGEDIGPLVRALREVRGGAAPFRLVPFPPFSHLDAKVGDRDAITPRR